MQGSPCTSLCEQALVIVTQKVDHVLMSTPKFCSNKIVRFGFLVVCAALCGVVLSLRR